MRSIWKIPDYLSLSSHPSNTRGLVISQTIGSLRRVYNGNRYIKQRIRKDFLWGSSLLFFRSGPKSKFIRTFHRAQKKKKKR